ncbi:MAG: DUF4880 domain-containing protein [Zoogloeaceae bacterium]|jgi:transmembrane sensor|nr:DUF4880 domain-containing protein [Zoogloeaceae bacterium]
MKKISLSSGEDLAGRADDLEAQAWRWLRLLRSGEAREADAERFRRWAAQSPARRTAYATVKRRWDAVDLSARKLLRRDSDAASFRNAAPPSYHPAAGHSVGSSIGANAMTGLAAAYLSLGVWPRAEE